MSLGIAEAGRRVGLGLNISLAVDFDARSLAVYQSNFPGAKAVHAKVEDQFDGALGGRLTKREQAIAHDVGPVDVLVGGPPCQGHSNLNNLTRRDDTRNAVYARMARAAEVLNPRIVLIENVPAVRYDVNRVLELTLKALQTAGYITGQAVLDLSKLGAPQRRRRHVLLAVKNLDCDPTELLATINHPCSAGSRRTVRWAIEDLIDSREGALDVPTSASKRNVGRVKYLFKHDVFNLPNSLRPHCHQSDHSYLSMYGRLRWDEPAQTVTTGFGSMGQGRYVHPSRQRTITAHEAARLQMLPDFLDFSACTQRGAIAQMIGNAAPPVLVSSVVMSLLTKLNPDKTLTRSNFGAAANGRDPSFLHPTEAVSRRMRSTRQHDTLAEKKLVEALKAAGLSDFQTDVAPTPDLRTRADVLFTGANVAIFVDGCYWHGCPEHATLPKRNSEWWKAKLESNMRRDSANTRKLLDSGWTVLRFWEHEQPTAIADIIATALGRKVKTLPSGDIPREKDPRLDGSQSSRTASNKRRSRPTYEVRP